MVADRYARPVTPWDTDGIWLRCALHAHTTNSDGELAPEMLVRHYEWAGYDVLAITDHWVRTEERSTKKLLVIPSTELNAWCGPPENDAHVLALGVQADPVIPDNEFAQLQEVVDWILANGGVPYIAHTYWSGLRTDLWESCEGLLGLEVWNAGCELEVGRGDSSLHWDEVLERGRQLVRARDRRLASSRLRQRLCVDLGARRREVAGGGARRAAHRRVLRLDRAVDPRCRGDRRRGGRALQPGAGGHALLRPRPRLARERRAGSAIRTARRCSSETTTA